MAHGEAISDKSTLSRSVRGLSVPRTIDGDWPRHRNPSHNARRSSTMLSSLCTVLIWTLCGCGSGSLNQNAGPLTHTANRGFVVFDGTLYAGKPNLTSYGLTPLTSLYASTLWSNGSDQSNPPNPSAVKAILQQASASAPTTFLDIENWPLDGGQSAVADSVQKYVITLQSFEQFAPSLEFGYYGVAPEADYWDAICAPDSSQYKAWQRRNDSVTPIAKQANVLFPSIYTFYADENGWKTYAIAQIEEARRIAPGKPVYAFLWPRYQLDGAIGDYLAPDYWRMELETARQYADGLVIWGGYQETWDNNAPWWLETESFLKENGN